ncbi:PP2C family protein-serine/threonine phosphatase [Streptomyces sp. NPDC054933]
MIRTRRAAGTRSSAAPAAATCPFHRRALVVTLPGLWTAAVVTVEITVCGGIPAIQLLVVSSAVLAACLSTGRRLRLLRELERTRQIAAAAQRVLLRPLPRRVAGVAVAGDYISAYRGAEVGGDLYEVLATPYGVRVVLGDVRGHGLAAIGTVAALLGSFREAAHDEAELDGVLRRLDRTLRRHLSERARAERSAERSPTVDQDAPVAEEFVTVLLLEVRCDGRLAVLNCGHPWPYRIDAARRPQPYAEPLSTAGPLPPLGVLDPGAEVLTVHRSHLLSGQALFLHTDGAQDARDASGAFFPLPEALRTAARAAIRCGAIVPDLLVDGMRAALTAHAHGRLPDDAAMLALSRDPRRVPAQCAHRRARGFGGLPPSGFGGLAPRKSLPERGFGGQAPRKPHPDRP